MKTLLFFLLVSFLFSFISSAQDQRCDHEYYDKLPALIDRLDLDPEYHSRQEVYDFLDSIIPLYPEIAMLDTSWVSQFQGYKIPVVKISDNPGIEEDEPTIGYDGLMHSREPVSMETCLKLIEYLLTNYGTDPQVTSWVNNTEIFIMPMLNPDGWVYVCANWASHNMWYKNQHDNDSNGLFHPFYDGVNLNRNFDSNWEGGTPVQTSPRYRGAYPFSEKESQLKQKYASEQKYVLSINYHSAPDGNTTSESVGVIVKFNSHYNPEYFIHNEIADTIAFRTPKYENPSDHYKTQSYGCDAGYSDCWMIEKNGSIEFTVETAPELYPTGPAAMQIAHDNAMAGLYLLERVFKSGITGHIYDINTNNPLVAEVRVLELDTSSTFTLDPKTSDSLYGRYFRLLQEGSYTVEVSKEGYEPVLIEDVAVVPDTLTYLSVVMGPQSVDEDLTQMIDIEAIPNPSTGDMDFHFRNNKDQKVVLKVYDLNGREHSTLINGFMPAGDYTIPYNASHLPAGLYLYRITVAADGSQTGKLVIVR